MNHVSVRYRYGKNGTAHRSFGRRRSQAQSLRDPRAAGDRRKHYAPDYQWQHQRTCDYDRREGRRHDHRLLDRRGHDPEETEEG